MGVNPQQGPAAVVRRWALCRCSYARRPDAPCRCDEATLGRAERETAEQTRRWERRLLDQSLGGGNGD